MHPSNAVPADKLARILESICLTASASGSQRCKDVVVTSADLRAQIKTNAWSQARVTDCSHLLVSAARNIDTAERINTLFDRANAERGFKNEGWQAFRQHVLGGYPRKDAETGFRHAARQACIGLGTVLIAAAAEKVDSPSVEGFDPTSVEDVLKQRERGLPSVLVLPLDYRVAEGDWLVNWKRVRNPMALFVTDVA